jgi:hypothetical protein
MMTDCFIVTCCVALGTLSGACGNDSHPAPPVLGDVSVTTPEDTPVSVTVAPTAADPAAVTLAVVTPPSHGALTGSGPTWTYTPAADYAGADAAVITATDSHGSATATLTITVTAVDDAPVANPDRVATGYGVAATIAQASLLANDTDIDSTALSVTGVLSPVHGSVAISGSDVVFTPETGFVGLATFVYTVSDGALTAQGTVTVAVGMAGDQPPTAVADLATVAEGSTANLLDVLGNDPDRDGGAKAVAAVTQPVHGVAAIAPGGASVTYAPAAGYCNQAPNTPPDTFTYSLAPGGTTATVAVTVTCACGVHRSTDFVVGSN